MLLVKNILHKIRHFALYGSLMAILVFTLKWLQWKFLIIDNSLEIYIGILAVFFTVLGVWIASQFTRTKVQTIIVEKEIFNEQDELKVNEAELENLNLSNREYEVLQLLSRGLSNAEIGEELFLSLSTVKTHVSNLLMKMDVKSRMKAIEKAKRLKIIV